MKKRKKSRRSLKKSPVFFGVLAVLAVAIIAALIFIRPKTIEQRYPMLDLSECVQIKGYYYNYPDIEGVPFTINPEDPHFEEMAGLFRKTAFKTTNSDLSAVDPMLSYGEGDFKWVVMFRFEDTLLPNGDTVSGDLLHIRNIYGEPELFFNGETTSCSVRNRDKWVSSVMDIITLYPNQE